VPRNGSPQQDGSLLSSVSGPWAQTRGREGFFRVGQDDAGRWWLIEPPGTTFFAKAVHGLRAAGGQGDGSLPIDAAARLRSWGFNAVGIGASAAGRDDGLPFMASVDFCDAGPAIVAPGVRLPDVFDPDWGRRADTRAVEVCAPLSGSRELLGWVTDGAIAWAQPSMAGRPSLLQLCLSLEPGFAAYHAAWEFVFALHGGRFDQLARAWGTALPNKEVVRELTRAEEGLGTRGYLRDEARWTREFARRYFTSTSAAIRAADPNHLVLGCRFADVVGVNVLAECAYPAIDVALPDWRELPNPSEGECANPMFASNVSWVTPEFLKLPTAARVLQLTSAEWMLRRGRTALERLARHPAIVGYAWGQWQDEPGEQPPFARGLLHVNGTEAREHTELLAQFNRRAEGLRAAAMAAVIP
jgi:hypothetical protein